MAINLFDYTQEEEEEIHLPEMKNEESSALDAGESMGFEGAEGGLGGSEGGAGVSSGGIGASDGGAGAGGEGGGQGASGGMGAGE